MDAKEKRDEALALVSENAGPDFFQSVVNLLQNFNGSLLTGEDIRMYAETRHIKPHHHNAWGATTSKLIRSGMLEETGQYRSMRGPKSNSRKTPVYRVIMPEVSHIDWMISQLKTARSADRLKFLAIAIRQDAQNGLIPAEKLPELRKHYAQRVRQLKKID